AETLSYSPKWALIICTGMFLAAIPFVRGFSALFSEGQYVGAIGYAPMVLILPLILIGAIGGVIESKRNQREDNTELVMSVNGCEPDQEGSVGKGIM
ncbi:MAG: hypothetical protein VCB26_12635, partial [Candidatus Hydrogenedentota bacterium]